MPGMAPVRHGTWVYTKEMGTLIGGVDQILVMVIIGGIAGWFAASVLRVRALGVVGCTIVGVIGSFIGIVLFRQIDVRIEGYQIGPVPVGHLFAAFVGAILLVIVLRLFRGRRY